MKLIGLLLMIFSAPVLASEVCRDIASYAVNTPVSFNKLKLSDAVTKLMIGTPFVVKSDDSISVIVSGKDVSGPLDVVLKNMAESAHFTFSQEGCQIAVVPVDAAGNPIMPAWSVSKGDALASVLERWTKQAGWTLSYELDGKIILGADLSYKGEFEASVDALLDTIKKSSGVEAMHKFYYGNKALRVYRNALVEAAQTNKKEK